MLASGIGNTEIMISVFAFNLLWIFIDVYQMATNANIDHSWQLRLAHAWRPGTGADRWANITASIISATLSYSAVFIMCASMALGGLFIYALMYVRLRKTIPALIDAS